MNFSPKFRLPFYIYSVVGKPYLVGIAGASASGKTSFLHELRTLFNPGEVCILSQDNYYHPADRHAKDENGRINFDRPECIDLESFKKDISELIQGNTVKRREYRFQYMEQYGDWLLFDPAPIVVVEGLFIFHDEAIRNLFDLKVFIDTDIDRCFERRLMRDTQERNISKEAVLYQWTHHVLPAFLNYLLPYKELSDLVINNDEHFHEGLKVLENHFNKLLRN